MPAQVRSEFLLALNQVASERNVSLETILTTIEDALVMAYRKDRSLAGEAVNAEDFIAQIDRNSGEASLYRKKEDGTKGDNVTPPGFGRIAAQTAGQVLRQRIREAEKKAMVADFSQKIGTIAGGMVLRFDGPNVIVDINKAETVMPPGEQVTAERYYPNQRLIFYIDGIRESPRGSEIIVSRANVGLVTGLFAREVPEVQNKAVEIRLIAREAGGRTKLAVASTQPGVDPVGACVGQKGVRVQAVITELGGIEKVDIIQYSEDPAVLIAQALAPAKDIDVTLNATDKSALALVPVDQLSLAIGREGQNVRLAAKLTGWRIDIKGKGQAGESVPEAVPVDAAAPTRSVQLEEAEKKDLPVSDRSAPATPTDDSSAQPTDETQKAGSREEKMTN